MGLNIASLIGGVLGFMGATQSADRQQEAYEASLAAQTAATQAQIDAQNRAMDIYKELNEKALAETTLGREQSLAGLLSGQQISYDLAKAGQAQQMPWNLAALSALQTLPQLQSALGLPAYNIPTEIAGLPNVNFMQAFQQALNQVQPQQTTAAQPATAEEAITTPATRQSGTYVPGYGQVVAPEGYTIIQNPNPNAGTTGFGTGSPFYGYDASGRAITSPQSRDAQGFTYGLGGVKTGYTIPGTNYTVPIQAIEQVTTSEPETTKTVSNTQGTTSPTIEQQTSAITSGDATALTPYTGTFNMEASPLYQWQKKEISDALKANLSAQGLSQSTYGQREETRAVESLAAQERERQVANMFNMVGLGFGMPVQQTDTSVSNLGANIANILGSSSANTANLYSQMGSGLAQGYTNIGGIQGAGLLGQGATQLSYSNMLGQQQPAWLQALGLMQSLNSSGLFSGSGTSAIPYSQTGNKEYFFSLGPN